MFSPSSLLLAALFCGAALLYASVGNAGATSYLAVMSFFGLPHDEMRATALALNVIVASIAAYQFWRAGCCDGRLFWPFAVTSIPFSWLGGSLLLPARVYHTLVAVVLLYAAWRLLLQPSQKGPPLAEGPPPLGVSLAAGAAMGFVAGLSGLGGGIFLGALLVFSGWAEPRRAAGASALFNLVNSLAGLGGQLTLMVNLPPNIPLWGFSVAIGGWLGARLGSRHLASRRLQQILGVILFIAALRLLFA